MDNFNLTDFVNDFEFDFQNDFNATENQVIDEILTTPIETDGIFSGMHENSSSFLEYFCDDPGADDSLGIEEQLQHQHFPFLNENGTNQADFNYAEIEALADGQNHDQIDFDWTTFLQDKSLGQLNVANEQSIVDQQNPAEQNALLGLANVINDNGFIYQELKTLDLPQIYGDLDKAFGLDDLKQLEKSLDLESLTMAKHPKQQGSHVGEVIIGHQSDPIAKKKLFLVPLQLDSSSRESLRNVAAKLKENPMVLNSMLNNCSKSKSAEKVELSDQPTCVKPKSEQYLNVRERLKRMTEKEAALAMVNSSMMDSERRQRKCFFNLKHEKIPMQYAVQIVLNDINQNGIFGSKETNTARKPTKAKKQVPKSKSPKKPRKNIEAVNEPKRTRQSIKKIKI